MIEMKTLFRIGPTWLRFEVLKADAKWCELIVGKFYMHFGFDPDVD